jgi:hypothetical protein
LEWLRASHGGVTSTAWCSSHGSMCADVPMEVPLQRWHDHGSDRSGEPWRCTPLSL